MAVVNYLRSLGYVFVCRRLSTNKKVILCVFRVSSVNKSSSAYVGVGLRLIFLDAMRHALCCSLVCVSLRKSAVSFPLSCFYPLSSILSLPAWLTAES